MYFFMCLSSMVRTITYFTQGEACLNTISRKLGILNMSILKVGILEVLYKNSHLS